MIRKALFFALIVLGVALFTMARATAQGPGVPTESDFDASDTIPGRFPGLNLDSLAQIFHIAEGNVLITNHEAPRVILQRTQGDPITWNLEVGRFVQGNGIAIADLTHLAQKLIIEPGSSGNVIFPSGNVGIGTNHPTAKLNVEVHGGDAVHITSLGSDGVVVNADDDGLEVKQAGDNGVKIVSAKDNGLRVNSAGDIGVLVEKTKNYAAYFNGNIRVTGTCAGCDLAIFGHNAGQQALEPGDVVAVRGITASDLYDAPVMVEVELAAGPDAVIGVVAGQAEVYKDEGDEDEAAVLRLVPRDGPAQPGEYVNIIIDGLARVKASAVTGPIRPGMRLTTADYSGHVRAIRTVEVQGVKVAEGTPIVGIALESLESEQHLIWVLVNPR